MLQVKLFEDPTTNSDDLLSTNAVVLYPYEEKLMPPLHNVKDKMTLEILFSLTLY